MSHLIYSILLESVVLLANTLKNEWSFYVYETTTYGTGHLVIILNAWKADKHGRSQKDVPVIEEEFM